MSGLECLMSALRNADIQIDRLNPARLGSPYDISTADTAEFHNIRSANRCKADYRLQVPFCDSFNRRAAGHPATRECPETSRSSNQRCRSFSNSSRTTAARERQSEVGSLEEAMRSRLLVRAVGANTGKRKIRAANRTWPAVAPQARCSDHGEGTGLTALWGSPAN
jgi:hypothetical protein